LNCFTQSLHGDVYIFLQTQKAAVPVRFSPLKFYVPKILKTVRSPLLVSSTQGRVKVSASDAAALAHF